MYGFKWSLTLAQEEVENGRGQFVVGQKFRSLTTFTFLKKPLRLSNLYQPVLSGQ